MGRGHEPGSHNRRSCGIKDDGVVVAASSLVTVVLFLAGGNGQPWARRDAPVAPPHCHELEHLERWPSEPATPDPIDPAKFRESVAYLCAKPPEQVPADEILAAAAAHEVDPFLLAALMREQSRCDPKRHVRKGFGLLMIQPAMYLGRGGPDLPVERAQLTQKALLDGKTNLEVGAQLLRMWQDQHADADAAFGGVPHRGAVAHFQWGDRVISSGNEDLVMTERRRLVARYQSAPDLHKPTTMGLDIVCPLEGIPRVATSGPGEDRDGGARQHRGLDIAASEGEPVRAMANGVVMFAGVNLRGAPRKGPIPPSKIARYRNRSLGAGGIYLCLRHDIPDGAPVNEVVTCYMHLSSYIVAEKDHVTAGQTIGFVGKTGVRVSPPHLHLEVRVDDYAKNPMRYLTDLVIPPKDTKTYHYVRAAKRARLRAERAAVKS
jgi:murein DD-endopeptidase MepM/ murein hydrolase activator NlpD